MVGYYSTGPHHVLPNEISAPQKKSQAREEAIQPNFHTDFKWCMWHSYLNPIADVWFFSKTKKICNPVWRVQDYLCVETIIAPKPDPVYFHKRTSFECTLT